MVPGDKVVNDALSVSHRHKVGLATDFARPTDLTAETYSRRLTTDTTRSLSATYDPFRNCWRSITIISCYAVRPPASSCSVVSNWCWIPISS